MVTRGRCRRAVGSFGATVVLAATLAVASSVAASAQQGGFVDVGGVHEPNIDALSRMGLFEETLCGENLFCPEMPITRSTMAVWLVRALDGADPAPVSATRFADVDASHPHAAWIERFAQLGVTTGCSAESPLYCPDDAVTRAQMATFLVRAFDLEDAAAAGFADTEGNFHAPDIDRLAATGITVGCATEPLRYCPNDPVTRAEMATFLARALGLNGPSTESGGPLREQLRVGIDTWDRDAVLAAYEAEFGHAEPDAGFTGDVSDCSAGTTSAPYRASITQRVNWYRQMAGLATVIEDPALTATAQHKALIMLAEGALSHTPSPDWACHTEIDHPGENLGLGVAGVLGVDGYMQDPGDHNLAVGHRQQILSPFVTRIGTGNVFDRGSVYRAANVMHLSYDWDLAPEVREEREFVAWPPPGFVPPETVWGRWSFARQRIATEVTRSGNIIYTTRFLSGSDFSEAVVAVSDDDGPVQTEIIHRDDALVWAVDGDADSALLPEPRDGDHCYAVKISGVQDDGTTQAPYEYTVCILDTGS